MLNYLLLLQRFWQLIQSDGSVWGRAVYRPPPWQQNTNTTFYQCSPAVMMSMLSCVGLGQQHSRCGGGEGASGRTPWRCGAGCLRGCVGGLARTGRQCHWAAPIRWGVCDGGDGSLAVRWGHCARSPHGPLHWSGWSQKAWCTPERGRSFPLAGTGSLEVHILQQTDGGRGHDGDRTVGMEVGQSDLI